MYKKIRSSSLILALILFISLLCSSVTYNNKSVQVLGEPSDSNNVNLVIDTLKYEDMVKNFRKTSDLSNLKENKKLNTKGLDKLNISGSSQFSEFNIQKLIDGIGTKMPITVVDLRQEAHGFINGIPVSWKNKINDANRGLTKEQVLLDEKNKLDSIKLNEKISFYNHPKDVIVVKMVEDEKKLTNSKSLEYIRIPVTDGSIPTDDMVDYFMEIEKNNLKDENKWMHFHCKEGIGRTTEFMIMHDMIRNYDKATSDEIIQRQLALASFNEQRINSFSSELRTNFLSNFYKYCTENGKKGFDIKWSQWNKKK